MAPLSFRILLLATLALGSPFAPGSPVVDLGYAKYQGTTLTSGVNQFLGMRFAQPPLGSLRWQAPQAPAKERGITPADSFGPICIGVGQSASDPGLSEDCLFINVFSPSNVTPKSKLPVWFFIQGGGYAHDSNANFNGTDVVTASGNNLVFVNINYRVGALGFLSSEKIRKDGALNAGLLDQRFALEWVQQFIHLFGGDPDHVVIHGDSAGGGSVAYHLTAFGGRDDKLFIGAIPESPFFPTSPTVAEVEFQFDRFVNETGCSGGGNEVACLRGLDLDTIQAANVVSPFPGATGNPVFYFLPVIDGDFSQEQMYTQFTTGKFVKVPTLVGGDSDEGDTFVPNLASQDAVNAFLVDNFPHLTKKDLTALDKAYPPMPRVDHAAFFGQVSQLYGNSTFACGGLLISAAVSQFLGPETSWNYRYNIVEPSNAAVGLGVTHTSELPAIFGVGNTGPTTTALGSTLSAIVPVIMDYYISFVTTLNPNTRKNAQAPHFEGFGFGNGLRLLLQLPVPEAVMETVSDAQVNGCNVWTNLAPTTEQ